MLGNNSKLVFPFNVNEACQEIRDFVAAMEKHGVRRNFDQSFKLRKGQLLKNRFLSQIASTDMSRESLLGLCRDLRMPDNCLRVLEKNLEGINGIGFAYEEENGNFIYKVYLEYWAKLVRELRHKRNKFEPMVLHIGYKWMPGAIEGTVDDYMWYPNLAPKHIVNKLHRMYSMQDQLELFDILKSIILQASEHLENRRFIYLEVNDNESERHSYDINLNRTNLPLQEFESQLEKIGHYFGVDIDQFHELYSRLKLKRFSHIAGGVNRSGEEFITVYLES
jgi:hypothetical protein